MKIHYHLRLSLNHVFPVMFILLPLLFLFIHNHATAKEKPANSLINEKSPYLLKHATNPVNWFPWGEDAFKKAQSENKPIFLSIGYSTCHWCNVMEEESFSDQEVADLMNQVFISVKVDREERPDIDQIYMTVCQMLSSSCGWPLTIIMTPDKKPFYASTYLPKENKFGRPGILTLTRQVQDFWKEDQVGIIKSAEMVTKKLAKVSRHLSGEELGEPILKAAYLALSQHFDNKYGGFGSSTKFPKAHSLLFLLRYWKNNQEKNALQMVEKTLKAIRYGGIYDQLGFGFHRYSTDVQWRIPHFEKMLYDQAMLIIAYNESFQATHNPVYAQTIRETIQYIFHVMTSPGGAFYSAESADSDGEEGKFYMWKEQELLHILGKEQLETARKYLNFEPDGNYIDFLEEKKNGNNILYRNENVSSPEMYETIRVKLYEARKNRIRPDLDDKVLTNWNGLMIAALAKSAQALDEASYGKAAARAADFILNNMKDSSGRLLHRWRHGQAGLTANASDYAYLIWGLIELYEWDFDSRWLGSAMQLTDSFIKNFWDAKGGGFFMTPHHGEELLIRGKTIHDWALPSANSVAFLNLIRLSRLTGNMQYTEKTSIMHKTFSGTIRRSPADFTMFLTALDLGLQPSREVVIVGEPHSEDTNEMIKAIRQHFLPGTVVLLKPLSDNQSSLIKYAPFIENMTALKGKSTAYVCTNFSCKFPTTNIDTMLNLLRQQPESVQPAN